MSRVSIQFNARVEVEQWTCDQCKHSQLPGVIHEMRSKGVLALASTECDYVAVQTEPPKGWGSIGLLSGERKMLCPDCFSALMRFFK